jgi:hypothetical protein
MAMGILGSVRYMGSTWYSRLTWKVALGVHVMGSDVATIHL